MAWVHINDNQAQRTHAFKKVSVTDRIVGWNLDYGIFAHERNSPCLYPLLMAQSIGDAISKKKEADMGYIYSIAIANCTAPGVQTKALPMGEARSLFMRNAITFIHHCQVRPRSYGSLTLDTWNAELARIEGPPNCLIPTAELFNQISDPGFMTTDICTTILASPLNFYWAYHMLLYIVQHTPNPLIVNASSLIYIYTYVSFAKRGTITEAKAKKISDQIALEIDTNVDLDNYLIAEIYANLSGLINEVNAETVFTTWANNMKTMSLRMRITLEQVSGSGLTTYNAIRDSIRMFKDFAWDQIFGLLSKDTDNFVNALMKIGGNNYFGFSQDLATVGSSKYKSLGYVAKEMLRLYGGPEYAALSKAACWTKSPLKKEALDQLIEEYGNKNDDKATPADAAFVRTIMGSVALSFGLEIEDGVFVQGDQDPNDGEPNDNDPANDDQGTDQGDPGNDDPNEPEGGNVDDQNLDALD